MADANIKSEANEKVDIHLPLDNKMLFDMQKKDVFCADVKS